MYRITNGAKGVNVVGVYKERDVMISELEFMKSPKGSMYILLEVNSNPNDLNTLLKNLSVDIDSLGGIFIKDAIEIGLNDIKAVESISKVIYPALAKKYNVSTDSVERRIRHEIEKSWRKVDENFKARIFGNIGNDPIRPSNMRYIKAIVRYLI